MSVKIFEKATRKSVPEHPSKHNTPKTVFQTRMEKLGKYTSVKTWRQAVPVDSTFQGYLLVLERLLNFITEKKYVSSDGKLLNPDGIIELFNQDPKKVYQLFTDFHREGLRRGKFAGSSKSTYFGGLQSFMQSNSFVRLNLKRPRADPTDKIYVDASYSLTKEHLEAMMKAVKDDPQKLMVVGLSAQVGQRRAILSSLRIGQVQGIWEDSTEPVTVFIPYDQKDAQGRFVNKSKTPYRFGFLRDSAQLIRNVVGDTRPTRNDKALLWDLSPKFFNDCIVQSAEKAGLQKTIKTLMGYKRNTIHHHLCRSYFKSRMRLASSNTHDPQLGDDVFLNFLIGHCESRYKGTYDRYDDLFVKNALTKAQKELELPLLS